MLHEKYEPVIGLEVHAQLSAASKAFSPDSASFGAEPNVHVDPISLGHPGTLPVLNRSLVEFTVRMGLATHCEITSPSIFARKHYFYPDLPKGYQISQYEAPICSGGYVEIAGDDSKGNDGPGTAPVKRIGLTRIHMEEDAGKSLHDQDPDRSYADYNRCGVPLMEIVSEPDIRSPREAYLFLQKIRQIVRYLGICDGNMEEGSLRCDANVSVRPVGQVTFGTKTEVKNMNSFRNVERALAYEIDRQIAMIEHGGRIVQQTLLWDANRMETRPMRSKEEAHDYRYFPDPDLVQVVITDTYLEQIREDLPEMPEVRKMRMIEAYSLPEYDAGLLTDDRAVAEYFEHTLDALRKRDGNEDVKVLAKAVSNQIMSDVLRTLNEQSISMDRFPIDAERMAGLIHMRLGNRINSSAAQEIFNRMLASPLSPEEVAEQDNLLQVSDSGALGPVVDQVLENSPKQVGQYLGGKESIIGYFVGQVMRTFSGSPDPNMVRRMLQDRLEAMREN